MRLNATHWDARYFQMAFQLAFLCYGVFFLHWRAEWWNYSLFVGSGLLFQFIADSVVAKKITLSPLTGSGWKSVLVSCFSLCLLLKTNQWEVCVVASAITIFSKYIFRFNGKHIFNPSALGIALAVYFSGYAWISPGQWSSNIVLFFAIICLGCIVVTRVQKLDVTLAFVGTYAGLLFVRQTIYLGWPTDFFIQSVTTGSLLLFSFFMITDPKTTPNHPVARIGWAVAVAAISFYLSTFKFINGAPIWVLVCTQPLVPLLDHLFKANRFEWKPAVLNNTILQQQAFPINSTIKP
ncbi:MAG: RnfABCDGE type electron transport complex subunit D [Chitinophagaceae bacterium]|nr:RnfABCDGE type electron transport complex subunit D [Chitinophagaceae bacterium]